MRVVGPLSPAKVYSSPSALCRKSASKTPSNGIRAASKVAMLGVLRGGTVGGKYMFRLIVSRRSWKRQTLHSCDTFLACCHLFSTFVFSFFFLFFLSSFLLFFFPGFYLSSPALLMRQSNLSVRASTSSQSLCMPCNELMSDTKPSTLAFPSECCLTKSTAFRTLASRRP